MSSAPQEAPFNLHCAAFADQPEARFAWLGADLGAALARLQQAIIGGVTGVSLVAAERGHGKSLLLISLRDELRRHQMRVACVSGTSSQSASVLLNAICDQLDIESSEAAVPSPEALLAQLNAHLLNLYTQRTGVAILVDDAEELDDESLVMLGKLTPLHADTPRLLHIVLAAEPAFQRRLHRQELHLIRESLAGRHELHRLTSGQTQAYVRHRLHIAGCERQLFSRPALRKLYHAGHGVPVVLNRMAGRAMRFAFEAGKPRVDETDVRKAAGEVLPGRLRGWCRSHGRWLAVAGLAALVLAGLVGWQYRQQYLPASLPADTVSTATPPVADELEHLQAILAASAGAARLETWGEILARWRVTSDDVAVPEAARCDTVIFPGFNCVGGTATLTQLVRFNRPMVLSLRAEEDADSIPVLLTGADANRVSLWINGRKISLSRAALQRVWDGHFYVPYRLPAELPVLLRRGDSGATVAWLDTHVRLAGGAKPDSFTAQEQFDDALRDRVIALQQRFGIPADGIVGPETLFAIMSLDKAGPHLERIDR